MALTSSTKMWMWTLSKAAENRAGLMNEQGYGGYPRARFYAEMGLVNPTNRTKRAGFQLSGTALSLFEEEYRREIK